ncbi:ribonuclease R family protein [Buchnera aphidicola]|uniref:ribonuclease R family protein n=1 Tax=Buchnera aphidicola TaxID=9 RepID=UPI0031B8688F
MKIVKYKIGKINIKILKKKINLNYFLKKSLKKYKISSVWTKEIIDSVNLIKYKKYKLNKNFRKDLRNIPFITIDEEDSYDFDDAIYCYRAKRNGNWKLLVAISDVSFYIKENSILDKEAFNRGNSIYFPLKVIPMFPEELSTKIFSLLPHQDRLCIICEMTLSNVGNLINYKHYNAIIKSHARLTYSNVIQMWNKDINICKKFNNVKQCVKNFYFLNNILIKNKELKKVIFFNSHEPHFLFNSLYQIKSIIIKKRNAAHNLIEFCMILANKSSALFIQNNKYCSLFRNHLYPTNDKIKYFRNFLKKFNLRLLGGKNPIIRDYFNLCNKLINHPSKEIIELELLKSTKKAFYSEKNLGHFGLAEKFYTHFTSPIRRYSDLIIHRIIKFILYKKFKNSDIKKNNKKKYLYNLKDIKKISKQCTLAEKKSDKAYKFVIYSLKFQFLKKKIGLECKGIISNIKEFGFFVKIDNFFLNGLVHVSMLKDDYYFYNKKKNILKGKRLKKIFSIGNVVKVKIISVKIKNKIIHLSLI